MSKQAREDQYAPIKANKPPQRRAPKTSPLAGRDPVQPNTRGNQGNK